MKRNTLLFIGLIFLCLSSTAQTANFGYRNTPAQPMQGEIRNEIGSAVTVFSENGDFFFLVINGVNQNANPQSMLRVEGMPQVVNDIQVVFADNTTYPISKRIAFTDPVDGRPINLTMKIVREQDGNPRLHFVSTTPLEYNYHPRQNEYVMLYGQDNNRLLQSAQQVNDNSIAPPPPANYTPQPVGPTPMSPQNFTDAINAIQGNDFENSKLSTAKTIANNNYFTTDQVIAICRLFSFDQNKLDFAKYAFNKTVDNNNYYKVNSVFSFDSNKQALNDYVNQNMPH